MALREVSSECRIWRSSTGAGTAETDVSSRVEPASKRTNLPPGVPVHTCCSFSAAGSHQSPTFHRQHSSVQPPRTESHAGKGEVHSLPLDRGVDHHLGAVHQQQPVALPAASRGRPRQQEPAGGSGRGGEEEERGCCWSCRADRQHDHTAAQKEERGRSSPVLKLLSDWLLSLPLLDTTTTSYAQPGVSSSTATSVASGGSVARQKSVPLAVSLTARASRSPSGRCHDNCARVLPPPSAMRLRTAAGTERTRRQLLALPPPPVPGCSTCLLLDGHGAPQPAGLRYHGDVVPAAGCQAEERVLRGRALQRLVLQQA